MEKRCDKLNKYREVGKDQPLSTPSLDELKQQITNGLNVVAAEYEAISEAQKQFGITEVVAAEYEAMRKTQKEFGGIEAVGYGAITETEREIKESECFISPKIAQEQSAYIAFLESELLVKKQKEDIEGLKRKMEEMENQINSEITSGLNAVAAEYEATTEAPKEFGITEAVPVDVPTEAMMETQKEFGSTEAVTPVPDTKLDRQNMMHDERSIPESIQESSASPVCGEQSFMIPSLYYEYERIRIETPPVAHPVSQESANDLKLETPYVERKMECQDSCEENQEIPKIRRILQERVRKDAFHSQQVSQIKNCRGTVTGTPRPRYLPPWLHNNQIRSPRMAIHTPGVPAPNRGDIIHSQLRDLMKCWNRP